MSKRQTKRRKHRSKAQSLAHPPGRWHGTIGERPVVGLTALIERKRRCHIFSVEAPVADEAVGDERLLGLADGSDRSAVAVAVEEFEGRGVRVPIADHRKAVDAIEELNEFRKDTGSIKNFPGAETLPNPDAIWDVPCDILIPAAFGSIASTLHTSP